MEAQPDPATIDAWAFLFRAYKQLYEAAEARLKAAGLPPLLWYDVLYEIYSSSERVQQNRLADRLLLPQYNISRVIDKMEADGVLLRERNEADRRVCHLVVTPQGKALLKKMWAVYGKTIHACLGNKLSKQDLQHVARIMGKIAASGSTGRQ